MTRKTSATGKHAAYSSYRLGCLPYVLKLCTKMFAPPSLRPAYAPVVAEGLQAAESLKALVRREHAAKSDAVKLGITARWEKLQDDYLNIYPIGDSKLKKKKTPEHDLDGVEGLPITESDLLEEITWRDSDGADFAACSRLTRAFNDSAA